MVDALATLSAMVQVNQGQDEVEVDAKPWYYDIKGYLEKGVYPKGVTENDKRTLRRLASGVPTEVKLEEVEWIQNRLDQLNLIEEKRLMSLCHGQLYQKRIKNAFDKKARPCIFKEGDLVLKKILPNSRD
ncbi:hypothetical protein CR513_36716, partial [Mucuna pruriens]